MRPVQSGTAGIGRAPTTSTRPSQSHWLYRKVGHSRILRVVHGLVMQCPNGGGCFCGPASLHRLDRAPDWCVGRLARRYLSSPGAVLQTQPVHFARWLAVPGSIGFVLRAHLCRVSNWSRYSSNQCAAFAGPRVSPRLPLLGPCQALGRKCAFQARRVDGIADCPASSVLNAGQECADR